MPPEKTLIVYNDENDPENVKRIKIANLEGIIQLTVGIVASYKVAEGKEYPVARLST